MRNVRNALFAVVVLAGAATYAMECCGIEVLRVSGIEVLHVETRSWGAPPGSMVHAVQDLGDGPMVVFVAPVDPLTGIAMVMFPTNHPSNQVELRDPGGVLLSGGLLTQWD